ncbi:SdiA-regulated domain-containing protein [Stutzerimonas nitrititolerans]|uniref:SdiA-regulated domain-containing protein n=1 Tax=Stutzerimonas nitrititolerans TaxID=2482751 RepID=UPI0015E3BAB7|nr:SdiA-regulated domain-containing protein [Stutzerimonas nitrititolerans]MBA1186100.1 SdiA-regulated domain-containing protein [Stutzerimonas stutzeri]
MSAAPNSRWRLAAGILLLFLLVAVLIAGRLLHWDDQLRLYWNERSVSPEQRAAGIWLPDYELALETTLAGLEEDETSGLSWSPLTGTLFTVTGQNPQLVEFTPAGVVLRRIHLSGFADPEAVEVLDDGRLAIFDERRRLVAVFRLEPGVESVELDDLAHYDLGFPDAGNKGFEGLAWDPHGQRLLLAKERDPLGLFALPNQPLLVRDLSSLAIDPRSGHMLMLSDESRLLVELDLQGEPRSFISLFGDLNGLVQGIDQAEGVAMDGEGNIYVVGEPNRFFVFSRRSVVARLTAPFSFA